MSREATVLAAARLAAESDPNAGTGAFIPAFDALAWWVAREARGTAKEEARYYAGPWFMDPVVTWLFCWPAWRLVNGSLP